MDFSLRYWRKPKELNKIDNLAKVTNTEGENQRSSTR
jgi:hypothetical protein